MSKCEHGLKSRECYVCMSPMRGEQVGSMDRETVIRLAQEAGMKTVYAVMEELPDGTQTVLDHRPFLERFSALVEKDVLDRVAETVDNLGGCYHDPVNSVLKALAETIRGRHGS